MLATAHRLTKKRDIQKIYKHGKTAGTRWFYLRAIQKPHQPFRVAVIIGKKIAKKAVVRNRLKRLTHQALQELLQEPVMANQFQRLDCLLTIHRDPEEPYTLEKIKSEVATCFAKLP